MFPSGDSQLGEDRFWRMLLPIRDMTLSRARVKATRGRESGGGSADSGLFKEALLSSPYWPKTYTSTSPEAQWIYDTLVNRTGCYNSSGHDGGRSGDSGEDTTLACLKSLPVQTIRQAAEYIASSHTYTTSSYTFAPVIDGLFLKKSLTETTDESYPHPLLNSNAVFATYNTHEGESFLPPDLVDADDEDENGAMSTNSLTRVRFTAWIKGFLPNLTNEDLEEVKNMYPRKERQRHRNTRLFKSEQGCFIGMLSWLVRLIGLPGRRHLSLLTRVKRDIRPMMVIKKVAVGWPSTASVRQVNWWNSPQPQQQTLPLIYEGFTGSFASFSATGDPNRHKLTPPETPGLPELGTTNEEFMIRSDGFTSTKVIHLKTRCDFWRRLAPRIPI